MVISGLIIIIKKFLGMEEKILWILKVVSFTEWTDF